LGLGFVLLGFVLLGACLGLGSMVQKKQAPSIRWGLGLACLLGFVLLAWGLLACLLACLVLFCLGLGAYLVQ
jgi:hypothetical protein